MMPFLRAAFASFAICSVCHGIEIDPTEQPLLRIRFPLNDTVGEGIHIEVVYVLLKSGIGYSVRNGGRARPLGLVLIDSERHSG